VTFSFLTFWIVFHNNNNVSVVMQRVGCYATCFVGNNIIHRTSSLYMFFHSNKPTMVFTLQQYSLRECFWVNFDQKSPIFIFFLILIQRSEFHIDLRFFIVILLSDCCVVCLVWCCLIFYLASKFTWFLLKYRL